MISLKKFTLTTVAGFIVLILCVTIYISVFSSPEQVESANLIKEWALYRVAGYLLAVTLWPLFCRFLTRSRVYTDLNEEEVAERNKKRLEDYIYLKSLWWKILIFCVVFELVVIQQLGLA